MKKIWTVRRDGIIKVDGGIRIGKIFGIRLVVVIGSHEKEGRN
jgi:hypothetical protein